MKDFVEYIVKNLVDQPEVVKINEIEGTNTLIIELSVSRSDVGKIIGKKGKSINALRALLSAVAGRHGMRVSLEILEEGQRSGESRRGDAGEGRRGDKERRRGGKNKWEEEN